MAYGRPTYQSLGPDLHKALQALVNAYDASTLPELSMGLGAHMESARKVLAEAAWIRKPYDVLPEIVSYASGSGALSFTYREGDTSVGRPVTIGEVANSWAWKDLQDNIKNFDYILADFGSPEHPQVSAFSPVRRVDENHLRAYFYGIVAEYRYEKDEYRYKFWFNVDLDSGQNERELANLSMVGSLQFFLEHEQVCTEALALRDLREDTKGIPHLIPLVQKVG